MRASQFLIATQKEVPADAEVISHKLMLRAGLVRKLASGLYTWLPMGLKVLRKVEAIVREEMAQAGAQEVLMPIVQPAELWQESERWQAYGPELLRMHDRHQREFCLGPTHEEVITDLIRNEISSYKQLPANFYQIQTKFRDEVRPRFGVMRSREFIMKDAYSFHLTQDSLQATYDSMYASYCKIFERIGLDFRPVLADTGSIGGSASHEFHVLADSGEDDIAFSDTSQYAANVELAEALAPADKAGEATEALTEVSTPGQKSIEQISAFLGVDASQTVKTLIVLGEHENDAKAPLVALVVRGDHSLNEIKAEKISGVHSPLSLASDEQIKSQLGASAGSLGPVSLKVEKIVVDQAVHAMTHFICGANKDDVHYRGAHWARDVSAEQLHVADIRKVLASDPSPDGEGNLVIKRGIEVGHIFQLGTKYSEALNAKVQDEKGAEQAMIMGCYGIGITRIVAAAIEQNHDQQGIIWPEAIAPFQLAIVPVNMKKSALVEETSLALYQDLREVGYDVLLMDDPKARLGATLADVELIGIPHRIVIGERSLKDGVIEYRYRRDSENQSIAAAEIKRFLLDVMAKPAR